MGADRMPLEFPWHLIGFSQGFDETALNSVGSIGTALLNIGVFKPSGIDRRVICPECGGRCSDATFYAEEKRWRVYCGKIGTWNTVNAAALDHYQACMETLLKRIAEDLGARRDANPEIIPDKLYSIGRFEDYKLPPVFLVRGEMDAITLDLVIARLRPVGEAVVLCVGDHSQLAGSATRISFFHAANVISFDEEYGFAIDVDQIEKSKNAKVSKSGSKPKRDWKPVVRKLHQNRKKAGLNLSEVTEEAKALADQLATIAEHKQCRAVGWSSIYKELFWSK